MEKKIYTLVVKKFITECEGITDTNLILTNYTEETALEKFRTGSAKNGAKLLMVGDAIALKKVLPRETRTRIMLQDEFNTTLGYMSVWNGYSVAGFDVVADDDETGDILGLPTNRIYGVPTNGSKLIHVAIGSTLSNTDDTFDNNDLSIVSTFRKELGVELATAGGKVVRPKTLGQKRYIDGINRNNVTFGIGPAGTGKTYLAVAYAVSMLKLKKVNKIIVTRPIVEAGENLGFLPGELKEKVDRIIMIEPITTKNILVLILLDLSFEFFSFSSCFDCK